MPPPHISCGHGGGLRQRQISAAAAAVAMAAAAVGELGEKAKVSFFSQLVE